MEYWDNIIHTALLGTDKRQLKKEDFSEDLAEAFDMIPQSGEKEEQYLSIAAVAFNYRKCGVMPVNKIVERTVAKEEVKVYCSSEAHQVLNDVLSIESQSLFALWLQECNNKNQIVLPEYIPLLFDLALKYKQLQQLIIPIAGKRGEWLLPLNNTWKFEPAGVNEDLWQTGTLDQRKNFIKELRQTDPTKARELLQQAWAQENANTKAELLKQLTLGISNEDVEWFEQLMSEKSQKVKEEALKLLKQIPTSYIVQQYWEILKQSLHIKKERGLLGIGSKTVLEIALINNIDESIFKSGIEMIASEKNSSDNDFILYQLISAVPPSFFEQHFGLDKQVIIDVFLKSKSGKQFITAFGLAAAIFKEVDWLKAIIGVSKDQFYPQAFELLSNEEIEKYAIPFLTKSEAYLTIESISKYYKGEWSLILTREIFKYTVRNQYGYPRSFYNQNILSIPAAIIPEFDTFTPDEEYLKNMWNKTSEYLFQLLSLRTQTLKAFQS